MFELTVPLTNPNIDKVNIHVLYLFHAITNEQTLQNYIPNYHTHDFLELSILLEGTCAYRINDEHYLAQKGDVLILNPGVYHQEIITPNTICTQLHIGIQDIVFSASLFNLILEKKGIPVITLHHCLYNFFSCCQELLAEQSSQSFGYHIALKSLVTKLLILLCRELVTTSPKLKSSSYTVPNTEKHLVVQSIMTYIQQNYTEDISLDLISKNMYLSSVYISKIFKELTNDSPIHYLIKIRLEKAYTLLLTQNMSIKMVANAVGYKDAYHFSKLFKKHYGVSPSKVNEVSYPHLSDYYIK